MPCVYQIEAPSGKKYVGSTMSSLVNRKNNHRCDYTNWKTGKKHKKSMACDLFEEEGFYTCVFSILEELPTDTTKKDLLEREKYYFLTIDNLVNKKSPVRTAEEKAEWLYMWQIANVESRRESSKLAMRRYRAKKKAHITSDCPSSSTEDTEPSPVDTTGHS